MTAQRSLFRRLVPSPALSVLVVAFWLLMSDSFTRECLALLPELQLAAVFSVSEDAMSVLIVQSRDGESLCEPNRQTVPLTGSHRSR